MPLITFFECEKPCGKRIEIKDEYSKEASQILQVTDAMGQKLYFHNLECLKKWTLTYECPYLELSTEPAPTGEMN